MRCMKMISWKNKPPKPTRKVPKIKEKHFSHLGLPSHTQNRKKVIIFSIFFIGVLVGLGYLLFFSKYFELNTVIIEGERVNSEEEIAQKAEDFLHNKHSYFFRNSNFFLLPKKDLIYQLKENFSIESMDIDRQFFHTLSLTIHEPQPQVTWVTDDKYFYLDKQVKAQEEIIVTNIMVKS